VQAVFQIDPIGTVEKTSENQTVIHIWPHCSAGLLGMVSGDCLDVLYWMHELPPEQRRTLKAHPKGDRRKPLKGVFGLRSPMRPNPIAISTVMVQHIEGRRLYVTPFDAFKGSPIIDIKAAKKSEDMHQPRGVDPGNNGKVDQ
jgi:tRNA-Thr(GGU) m(6)t(6)A37 methyltransferase TsaA